jgi:peptide/nickel transport system permease protein
MVAISSKLKSKSSRFVRHESFRFRTSLLALTALLIVCVYCVSIVTLPTTSKTLPAKETVLEGNAICLNKYIAVPYGGDKSLDGEDVLVAMTPPIGTHGVIFQWTINDGGPGTATGKTAEYTWNYIGVWQATLTVIAPDGNTSTDTMTVKVVPYANGGASRVIWENDYKNLTVTLNASGSASEYNITDYEWSFQYRGSSHEFTGQSFTFTFSKAGLYTVQLKVTDEMGNVGYGNVTVNIKRLPTFYEEHWLLIFVGTPLIILIALMVVFKYRRDHAFITATDKEKVRLQVKNFKITWKIFKANRLGFAGLIVLLIFVVMAIFAPWISTVRDPNKTTNLEPSMPSVGWLNPLPPSLERSPYTGYIHPFGTDQKGQDIYSSTMYGARASLEVGLAATLISVIVGAVVGLAAGYFGKITDEVLMRTTDFFLVIPWFPLMIVMMAILGQKFIWVVVVIGITSWPSTARIVRSQVLTVKERQFIVRAKCVGAPDSHILRRHIMPNVLPLIFANTVLLVAIAIFNEAFLDFFGLGDPTVISWGTMLESAYERDAFVGGAWWWIIAPGAAIVIIVLAFSLVGYAIDDVLNPKLRRR